MIKPNALVLNASGINCNEETDFALEQAGAEVEQVHISQLDSGERSLDDYQILILPGGFADGDAIAAGRLLGGKLRERHGEALERFAKDGRAILGICNGFQVLVETGLLPYGEVRKDTPKLITLVHNQRGRFESRWTELLVTQSTSKFINRQSLGATIELPVANGEGRLVLPEFKSLPLDMIVADYVDEDGVPTEDYPANPSGSQGAIAAITNPHGNILGMMPHPERFVNQRQHPNWRRGEGARPYGAIIFRNIVNYAKEL